MINGLYTAASGMTAEMLRQDVVANNLANASTVGFKKDEAAFTAFPNALYHRINDRLDALRAFSGGASQAASFLQPMNPAIGVVGHGVQTHSVVTNFSDGGVTRTDRPLDFALKGNSLFTVELGDGSRAYTRAGNFTVNGAGQVTTQAGNLVIGVNGEPISAIGKEVIVDKSGRVLVDGNEVGRFLLSNYEADRFKKLGENLYVKGEADIEAAEEPSAVSGGGEVLQGFLEEANLKVVEEMVDMITVMRAYEANQKAIQMQDDTLEKVINEVGRVS